MPCFLSQLDPRLSFLHTCKFTCEGKYHAVKLHRSWQDGSGGEGTCHLPSLTRQKERSNSYTLPLGLRMHMCVHASTHDSTGKQCAKQLFFKAGDHEGGNKEAVGGGAERG